MCTNAKIVSGGGSVESQHSKAKHFMLFESAKINIGPNEEKRKKVKMKNKKKREKDWCRLRSVRGDAVDFGKQSDDMLNGTLEASLVQIGKQCQQEQQQHSVDVNKEVVSAQVE